MSSQLPHELSTRIAAWLETNGEANRTQAAALSKAYRQGETSTAISLAAYLTTRLPATYAAVSAALEQVQQVVPQFAPQSMLDVGAGPGTASFAAQITWPTLQSITMIEQDARFARLAQYMSPTAKVEQQPLQNMRAEAGLVMAAYVLAELPEAHAAALAARLWAATQSLLIIIEPGTTQGFARIRAARAALIKNGAHVIGPCTHANTCPMAKDDWCHFKTRLPRSRAHMQAKSATVPFEDESFSWIAVARQPALLPKSRIIAPPILNKIGAHFRLCGDQGVRETTIASRDKPAYKLARKKKWGESLDV